MKNSKCFSGDLKPHYLLSNRQLTQCMSLFNGQGKMSLTFIDLGQLQIEINRNNNQSFGTDFLGPTEQTTYNSFKYEKRKTEWLGGRLAVKHSAAQIISNKQSLTDWQAWEIVPNQEGRPYIKPQLSESEPYPEISISHSGNIACGLASWPCPCGIDLQKTSQTTIKIKKRFALPQEEELLNNFFHTHEHGPCETLTLLWSAKEAFRKAYNCSPLIGFTDLELIKITALGESTFTGHFSCNRPDTPDKLQCFLALENDFATAITFVGSAP